MCEKCEVRFYHRNIFIHSQIIRVKLLEKGFLWDLAEEYASMPMFLGEMLNIQLKPIKKNHINLDFTKESLVVEV